MTQVYDIPEGFDVQAAFKAILDSLPQWRLRKALSYRQDMDRFLCAKSFLMLEGLLRERFGLESCPEFSYERNGKPYIAGRSDIFFNISHCRKGIACVVSESPVGMDIEEIQSGWEDLAPTVLNPDELSDVIRSGEPAVRFTEIWTRKESFLKLTGEGLADNMKDVLSGASGVLFKTELNRSAGYVLTLATWNTCGRKW